MDTITRDINKWPPRLIEVWRKHRRGGPARHGRLSPDEFRDVVAGVKALSKGLTGDRELAGKGYMDDPRLLGAYLLFYWQTSYAQARYAMGHLPMRPRRVLDLGSGPGPMSFAAVDGLNADVTAADRSQKALNLACELAAEAGEPLAARRWDPERGDKVPDGRYDLVIMGHLLNELWGGDEKRPERLLSLLEEVFERIERGGHLLIIEPALLLTSRRLLHLRDMMAERGYPVVAPCLFQSACPALMKEGNTCHTDRGWLPPQMVRDISRGAGLNKEALKMSFIILGKKGGQPPRVPEGRIFRIVSEFLESNKRKRLIGCGPEGRIGISVNEKDITDAFLGLKRGDVVRFTDAEDRENGIVLTKDTSIEVIARGGMPLS